jgi:hypothetical protein
MKSFLKMNLMLHFVQVIAIDWFYKFIFRNLYFEIWVIIEQNNNTWI